MIVEDKAISCSHNTDLVGNIKGVLVAGESDVGLLFSLGGNESVDLLDFDFVELLAGLLNHWLAGFLVNDEYKCVVVLNGLHGGFTGQWVLNNGEFVEGVILLDGSQKNLWLSDLNGCLW